MDDSEDLGYAPWVHKVHLERQAIRAFGKKECKSGYNEIEPRRKSTGKWAGRSMNEPHTRSKATKSIVLSVRCTAHTALEPLPTEPSAGVHDLTWQEMEGLD